MSDLFYTDDNGHKRCRNCNGDWTRAEALAAQVRAVEAQLIELELLADLGEDPGHMRIVARRIHTALVAALAAASPGDGGD